MSPPITPTPAPKATRANVKAILDYLLARVINITQARNQLTALGLPMNGQLTNFMSGSMSYSDVFTSWGV